MRIYGYERTPKTYNMIMNCISNNLEIERAFDTLDEMEALGITPQGSTYLYVAKLCLRMNEPVMVFDMLAKLESVGETTDPMWYMEALRCAVLCDDYTSVKNNWKRLILEQKQQPDDGLCKHALLVAARNHDPQLAYDIFSTVGQLGYPYTDHHFACLIDTFASTADYKNTFRIFTTMRKAGITPTKSTAAPVAQQLGTDTNAIICARQALEELAQEKDGVDPAAFNLIIHTFAYNGEFDQAMRTFDMAQQLGVTPDEDTLDALLDACIHQRSATRGEDLLDSFIRSGIQPTVVTLSKMVALMCTQDDYEDAFVYLEKIKKTGHVPLRGAYYRLIKKLSASNDPRLPMAIEDMEACGYSLSTHLDDYMDDKALLHEKRERKRLKEMAAEEFN
ncbi:hypothetical protein BC941DRAFT_138672 [Chlamydoabsidia padenii]|nr:hypothetical protein BC941DRAFT_138672 [Chlamydoabsidia padenii]